VTIIFFDTETTGLPDPKMPSDWEGQPHICQLGAIVTDQDGRVKTELNVLVKPDGWTIPASASAIHGIYQADAERYGLSIKGVLSIFDRLIRVSERVVAHNIEFDLLLIEIQARRTGVSLNLPVQHTCTMKAATDIVKCPPTDRMLKAGMSGYKKPNLTETYRHFFGRDFEGAHDAMADVRACRDVFFELKKLGAVAALGVAA
jgi:DNA polymerase-3 subunit epsilon